LKNKGDKMAITYSDSGVDVERGYKAVELMKEHVRKTYDKNVIGDLGSFGGFYSIADDKSEEPVLVAGCDGVGTKLKYAFVLDRHDTIGIDAVAMCVNDIVCQGARPLFFLDYFATGKIRPEVTALVVKGVAEGCLQAGCALLGGETAEMPGFYPDNEYDLAGFAVGIVGKKDAISGSDIVEGDALIGLASSGIHSNGYSLVRKLFGEDKNELLKYNERLGCSLADAVLKPTRIYVKSILSLMKEVKVKGIAHITGGGFIENIPRIFPEGIGCEIDTKSYPMPELFKMLKELSGLDDAHLYNTFNMGIGMVVALSSSDVNKALACLERCGEKAFVIGKTVKGKGVELK